ncbi:MAG: hypothetical protein IJI48_04170, partial [Ruminococcus sp.]|nr:hypothetical protein [Ruminococcus sp.]
MLKTRKLISLLLVVSMLVSVFSVALVSTSAAATGNVAVTAAQPSATITAGGESQSFHVGDTIKYTYYMNASDISPNGKISGVDAAVYYDESILKFTGDREEICPNLLAPVISSAEDVHNGIKFNDSNVTRGFKFNSDDKVLVELTFEVIAEGTTDVYTHIETLYAVYDTEVAIFIQQGEVTDKGAPAVSDEVVLVNCPHPEDETTATEATEPVTEATQPATTEPVPADKAVVTLYALDGTFETKTFDIGDEFTVYTMLNSSANDDGKISTVAGEQYYTKEILKRMDALDDEDLIDDVETVFPILSQANVIGNGMDEGALYFSGSNASKKKPYMFDNDSCKLVVTQYKVTAGGTAEVRTNLKTLALTDDYLTRVVDKYVVQPGMEINFYSSFTDP